MAVSLLESRGSFIRCDGSSESLHVLTAKRSESEMPCTGYSNVHTVPSRHAISLFVCGFRWNLRL